MLLLVVEVLMSHILLNVKGLNLKKVNASFERKPWLRKPIWMHEVNQQDKVQRAYIDMRQFQPKLESYKPTHDWNQNQRFQYSLFQNLD